MKSIGIAGKFAQAFIDSKLTPLIIGASVLLGIGGVLMLPREEEPQIVVPMIDIFVQMPGATAKEVEERGAGEIMLTSMDRDGTKDGYDIELTKAVSDAVNIPVIASGGCGNLEHIFEALTSGGASAALAASIFHYREYSVRQAKEYLLERGVTVRI